MSLGDGFRDSTGPAGWYTGGGGGQQLGQQRILLGQGLVSDDGDLTIARRGHEGDDAAALEEAQDALARNR